MERGRDDLAAPMLTLAFRDLAGQPAERWIPSVLPWVIEAGSPYFEWFFEPEEPGSRIREWMRRPSSEVALVRTTIAESHGVPVGGYIAIGGGELRSCRAADALAALAEAGTAGARGLMARLARARGLFGAVSDDEMYLSKMGLLPEHRGRRLGRLLVDRFLERARELGFDRVRLDVFAGNVRAIRLYRATGFTVASESEIPGTHLRFLAMTRP